MATPKRCRIIAAASSQRRCDNAAATPWRRRGDASSVADAAPRPVVFVRHLFWPDFANVNVSAARRPQFVNLPKPVLVTVVREPVARCVSRYYYEIDRGRAPDVRARSRETNNGYAEKIDLKNDGVILFKYFNDGQIFKRW